MRPSRSIRSVGRIAPIRIRVAIWSEHALPGGLTTARNRPDPRISNMVRSAVFQQRVDVRRQSILRRGGWPALPRRLGGGRGEGFVVGPAAKRVDPALPADLGVRSFLGGLNLLIESPGAP